MEHVVTASQMKACDSYTINEIGVPSCVLMERAALACALEVIKEADRTVGAKRIPVLSEAAITAVTALPVRGSCS